MKLMWTRKALDLHSVGKCDPRHTISAPNVADVYQGLVSQFKSGTPWALVNERGEIIDGGIA